MDLPPMTNSTPICMTRSRIILLVIGLVSIPLYTGCTSLLGEKPKGPLDNLDIKGLKAAGYTMGPSGAEVPTALPDDGRPSIVLEVHDGKKHLERIPLTTEKPTFIGDIVKDAQLVERIGRVDISILRPNGANQPPVRMDVDFDAKGRQVMVDQNYSLRAGDHVIVRKNSETFLDRMMQKSGRKSTR